MTTEARNGLVLTAVALGLVGMVVYSLPYWDRREERRLERYIMSRRAELAKRFPHGVRAT